MAYPIDVDVAHVRSSFRGHFRILGTLFLGAPSLLPHDLPCDGNVDTICQLVLLLPGVAAYRQMVHGSRDGHVRLLYGGPIAHIVLFFLRGSHDETASGRDVVLFTSCVEICCELYSDTGRVLKCYVVDQDYKGLCDEDSWSWGQKREEQEGLR